MSWRPIPLLAWLGMFGCHKEPARGPVAETPPPRVAPEVPVGAAAIDGALPAVATGGVRPFEIELRSISNFPTCLGNKRTRIDKDGKVFTASNLTECPKGEHFSTPYPQTPVHTLGGKDIDGIEGVIQQSGFLDLPAMNEPDPGAMDGQTEEIELTMGTLRKLVTVKRGKVEAFSKVRQALVERLVLMDTPAPDRLLWRARMLHRRYLVVFGPWHAAQDARQRASSFPVDKFLGGFLDGQLPDPPQRKACEALTGELARELATRPALRGPWQRYGELCAKLALPELEADLLLLLLAHRRDGGLGWLGRLLGSGQAEAGLPGELLAQLLDPLGERMVETAAALSETSRLAREGLCFRDTTTRRLELDATASAYLSGAALAARPAWARWFHAPAVCRERAAAVSSLGAAVARLEAGLAERACVVFRGPPAHGARWLASWVAARGERGLVEVDARVVTGDAETWRRVRAQLVLQVTTVLVEGEVARPDEAALVERLGEVLHQVTCVHVHGASDHLYAELSRRGALVVALPEAGPDARASWWQQALERHRAEVRGDLATWPWRLHGHPLGIEAIEDALQAGIDQRPDDVLAGVEAACQSLSPHRLDQRAQRLPPPPYRERMSLPPSTLERLRELRTRPPATLVLLELDVPRGKAAAAAALLAAELGVELFRFPMATLLAEGKAANRALTRLFAEVRSARAALVVEDAEQLVRVPDLAAAFMSLVDGHEGVLFLTKEGSSSLSPEMASQTTRMPFESVMGGP